ncbi:MAG: zf-HC2 domain-containing protein [Gammaproteobacteria bacterium]|nr:zf-HC2 domain-containing protein [Gammaproteobacteria bacterium]
MTNHQTIVELIPWYVNGSLNETETDRVSNHVTECEICAAEIEAELQLARGMSDPPRGLDRLQAAELRSLESLTRRIRETKQKRSPLQLAMAATVLIAVVLTAFVAGRYTQEVSYEAMTSNGADSRPVLQLIFHPEITEHDLRMIIVDSGGALLGGPSGKGVYRLALPSDVDAARYARRLRLHPALRWVEVELR